MGFGIETDVRDMGGELVISHDIPHGPCFSFDAFLGLYREAQSSAWLALNIKADGLSQLIRDALEAHSVSNYFVFDASVPDFMGAAKAGLNSYLRLSDVEADETLADMEPGSTRCWTAISRRIGCAPPFLSTAMLHWSRRSFTNGAIRQLGMTGGRPLISCMTIGS